MHNANREGAIIRIIHAQYHMVSACHSIRSQEARNERFCLKTGRLLEVTHAIQRLVLPAEELMLPAEEPGRKGHLHKETGTCV